MPVQGRPVLDYWLHSLRQLSVDGVLVNLHHHADEVREFLGQDHYREWVASIYEPNLLGTGGTLFNNRDFFRQGVTLLAHADNLCLCDLGAFLDFHCNKRPEDTVMTMMTFTADDPRQCGIAQLDDRGVVVDFFEKSPDSHGRLANAGVFLLEPKFFDGSYGIVGETVDFSRDIVPQLMGRIATWHNGQYLRDIGTPSSLMIVQEAPVPILPEYDTIWSQNFRVHCIHDWLLKL